MRLSEHHQKQVLYPINGADSDTHPHLTEYKKGFYRDSENMVMRDTDSNDGSIEKVSGDSIKYLAPALNDGYICIGSIHCQGNFVEFFAKQGEPSYIRINGYVMVYSGDLPLTHNHHLQLDKNESCVGGEVFGTDNNVEPFIFNIGDIIDNYNVTQKYFTDFVWNQYTTSLSTSLDHPVFIELVDMGSDGQNVSMRSYSFRYVDSSGNYTGWSVPTPYIPIPKANFTSSVYEPTRGTYGNYKGNVTSFAPKIRFRVNNVNNYSYIEVKRVVQADGFALDWLETPQKMRLLVNDADGSTVDIMANKYMVIDFIDDKSKQDWEDITDEELAEQQPSIVKAKSLRYFQNRLILANYKEASKDVEGDVTFIEDNSGNRTFPVVEKLGKLGHSDIYNQVYYKNFTSGEKFKLGVKFYDSISGKSLVVPIEDVTIPNRREEVTGDSLKYSETEWKGVSYASKDGDTGIIYTGSPTYESYDHTDEVLKTDLPSLRTIKYDGTPADDYHVLSPINQDNGTDDSDLGHNITTSVWSDMQSAFVTYTNKTGKNYYSKGISLRGLSKIPSGYNSFSIVRSKQVGATAMQGLGFFSFNNGATKKTNAISVYFPDLYTGLYGIEESELIGAIGDMYELEIISPVGYRSEVFSGWDANGGYLNPFNTIDMLVDADRIYNDLPYIQNSQGSDGSYYATWGLWRNYPNISNFSTTRGILNTELVKEGRNNYIKFNLTSDIYKTISTGGNDIENQGTRNYHEPFYIVNLVRKNKDVPDNNYNDYIDCGHYQKAESLIGVSEDIEKSYQLVDERWEDCIPNSYSPDLFEQNRYIYIDGGDGVQKRWINVTSKGSSIQNTSYILNELTANGYCDINDIDVSGNAVSIRVYGVYLHTNTSDKFYTIDFKWFNGAYDRKYFVPNQGAKIYVKYDNRIPIKAFIGDSYISNIIFNIFDRYAANHGSHNFGTQVGFGAPLPYYKYKLSSNYKQLKHTIVLTVDGWDYYNKDKIELERIRQMACRFVCETRYNFPMSFSTDSDKTTVDKQHGQLNYVMKLLSWKDGSDSDFEDNFDNSGDKVDEQFKVDYPFYATNIIDGIDGTNQRWFAYGGIMTTQANFNNSESYNLDYSKELNNETNIDKPKIGFKENTEFCTGVIWSEQRSINEQDDPNLKSFRSSNKYNLSDANGEIKYLYSNSSALSSQSANTNNLFAITENGISLLITDRNILSTVNGEQLAYIKPSEGFVQSEVWISNKIGSDLEMWRGIAEYDNMLFIPNKKSVFMLYGIQLVDIAESLDSKYKTIILPILDSVQGGYTTKMCSAFDVSNKEYWLNIGDKTYIFKSDGKTSKWIGKTTYSYEKMSYNEDSRLIYGTLNRRTFKNTGNYTFLSQGLANVVSKIDLVSSPNAYLTKEFIDLTVNSTTKPTTIYCYKDSSNYSVITASQIRDYNTGWYAMIPRMSQGDRLRLQNQDCLFVIENANAEPFRFSNTEIGYKIIR